MVSEKKLVLDGTVPSGSSYLANFYCGEYVEVGFEHEPRYEGGNGIRCFLTRTREDLSPR